MQPAEAEQPEKTQKLHQLAIKVCERGLSVPAIFLLELHKPLTGLVHGVMCAAAPLFAALFGERNTEALLSFLSSRENVEALIREIEIRAERQRAAV